MKFRDYLNESVSRYCHIYKAKDGKWYLELADREYAGREDATTYGPFGTEFLAERELNNHSNPGGLSIDRSGKQKKPKKSPNNRPIQKPGRGQWGNPKPVRF